MNQLIEAENYDDRFARLRNPQTKARINARLRRAELGNFGDCEPIGEGYRKCGFIMVQAIEYMLQRGQEVFILLGRR